MNCLLFILLAAETPPPPAAPPAKATFQIEPKARATDLVEAFQTLKNDKPTFKIILRSGSGTIYQNLTDLTAAANGTLLYLKILSNHGDKTVIVPTEEIEEISYSQ